MNRQDFIGEDAHIRPGVAIKKRGFDELYTAVYKDTSAVDSNEWFVIAERIVPEASMLGKQSTLDKVYSSKGVELYRQTICLMLSDEDIDQYFWHCP